MKDDPIFPSLLKGKNSDLIRYRYSRNKTEQKNRTRQKAEVFTPSWVCNLMNNLCDEEWFGRKDVFNHTVDKEWQSIKLPVSLEGIKHKSRKPLWQKYIDIKILEITCGEAPFLVSRYDATTGIFIPLSERIGLLDRKLRIVSENCKTEEDWQKWAKRAFESTYGYEYQGDSLLLARENLLLSYAEYFIHSFNKPPARKKLKEIANIIAWNLWQMDGLTDATFAVSSEKNQYDFFETLNLTPFIKTPSHICDWRSKRNLCFKNLKEGEKTMKFDFVIGNPPYQEEAEKKSLVNNETPKKNIFHYFQITADKISKISSVLIYPAGRWIHRSGKGMEKFGLEQINDKKLKTVFYYPHAKDIFPFSADIADGISIVIKKQEKKENTFNYIYCENGKQTTAILENPGDKIIPLNPNNSNIVKKIEKFVSDKNISYLHERILPRSLFSIESDFVEKNPDKVSLLTQNEIIDYKKEIKLFCNDKAGKSGRSKWYIADRNIITTNKNFIDEWQVVVSSANAGGQKRDNQIEIIDNHSAFGRSRVALSSFKTKQEAENFYKYCKSYIIRFAFLMTDEALTTLGKKVPDILDYKSDNKIINFAENIDTQLSNLIGLTEEENLYIKNLLDNLR